MVKTAALKKLTTKKKKPELKPVPQRKSSASKLLEEKHIGAEITNFTNIPDAEVVLYQNLKHYNYFYDYKDAYKWAESWIKKNRTQDLVDFKAAEEWRINTAIGGLCKMLSAGAHFSEKRMAWLNGKLQEAIDAGRKNRLVSDSAKPATVRTAADILSEKTSDFIAEVEHVLDLYDDQKVWLDSENYSVFNELKKINAPKPLAQKVYDYYKPLYDEIEELVTQKTPDLVEGYKHLKTAKDKKDYLAFIKNIIDDCQKFINAATASKVQAVRKPRAKKKVPVEKLIAKVKYQKESAEYKLTSVDPSALVGASEVYLFNTKYRQLVQLIAASVDGFSVKGTTITNMREESCLKKTLRKPEDVLKDIGATTKSRAAKIFLDLKTKPAQANGRLNEETIILKVYR